MARIRTYDAPIDRIRPDDRGFAAQETAARRLQFATQDRVQALREGGRLDAQNIRTQAAYDQEIAALQAPQSAAQSRGGGGGGSGGGGSRGGSAAPREAAQVAAALTRAVAGPSWTGMGTNTSEPRWLTRDFLSLRNPNGQAPYVPYHGQDELPFDLTGRIPRADYSPVGPGGNMQQYGYGTGEPSYYGTGEAYGPPASEAPTMLQRLGGWAQEFAGAIASGFAVVPDTSNNLGIDYVPPGTE